MAKPLQFLLLTLALILTLGLTACGGSTTNSSPTDSKGTTSGGATTDQPKQSTQEQVTITFQNIYPDPNTPSYKMMMKIVSDFETANPNIKIELDSLNTDQQKLKLKTQAASKEVPDITIVNPNEQMKPFVDAGLLAPLNDILDQNGLKDTFLTGILDYYTFDQNVYALPDGNNTAVVYYNKDMFAQAGVEVPTTFEAMIDVVKKLKAAGIQPMVIGEKDSWTGSFLFMNILLRTNGGPGFLQDVLDKKRTFNDPAFEEAVNKFQDLVQAGAFQDGATSFDYNAGENLFKSGKAAMYFMGTWATGGIDDSSVAGKIGAFKFPTVGGKGNVDEYMLAPGSAFAISANSKHLKESKAFLNYFMVNYPKVNFDLKNAVGLAQKVDGDFKAAGYSDLAMDLLKLTENVKGGDLAFDNMINPGTAQVHLTSIQNLFVQKKDAKEVAAEHQAAFAANSQ
ncbi:extracellular solute-binding protein [Paenibacillus sp. UMB4589-SE434]|uniref:extracellular solute-binding protein n=1 Tax=Paenibacillus sp. UMB4589-SE434 TaxID=3046314 RepID=UPI00254BC9B0|nr:extracellular solute-binding protein [Paenibacillus sp. UMB4589-SE434]MDK8182199.1 extracellular solute-binding protein [Paenibacillus sp. UMB4589-SE434]